jgi:hypothetical protein
MARLDSGASMTHLSRMLLGPAYLRKKLARPLPIKDATRLRTLADAVAYMAALPRHRECRQSCECYAIVRGYTDKIFPPSEGA